MIRIRDPAGRLVLILIRVAILVCVVVVVVEGVAFSRQCSMSVMEVDFLEVCFGLVVDIFQLAGIFAEWSEVEDLKLVEKAFVRLIWSCLNGRMYFLWPLSVMTVEEKMSNAGGHLSF